MKLYKSKGLSFLDLVIGTHFLSLSQSRTKATSVKVYLMTKYPKINSINLNWSN